MAKIDLARRAEIGREKRARTRVQIVDAGLILLAERPPEALTVDAIVESAGVAKGTFYYHFQSVEELVAAVGARVADTFDELVARSALDQPDPIGRMSFAFTKFLEKAISDPVWARLVVRQIWNIAYVSSSQYVRKSLAIFARSAAGVISEIICHHASDAWPPSLILRSAWRTPAPDTSTHTQ